MQHLNLTRYKKDLENLKKTARLLEMKMQLDCFPKDTKQILMKQFEDEEKVEEFCRKLPDFNSTYQSWYSEGLAMLRQILPDRVTDFRNAYEIPKGRKTIEFGNYVLHDYMQGLQVKKLERVIVDGKAAIPQFRIQKDIIEAAEKRFDSSLYEIATLVQADLLDNEIEAARTLLKNGYTRAAGAVAGVVLESHLKAVCSNHVIKTSKSNPTISTLNDSLKDNAVIDVSQWRFIQHLGDIRNLCDHKKQTDPTKDQVQDLIDGVAKVSKTVS